MAERRGGISVSKRVRNVLYAAAAFFAIGYFPTMMMPGRNPVVSMALAAAAIIPFGCLSGSVRQGVLRGAALGAIAGAAISAAMVYRRPLPVEYLVRIPLVYLPATAAMCAVIAGVFAHMSARRRRLIEEEWLE